MAKAAKKAKPKKFSETMWATFYTLKDGSSDYYMSATRAEARIDRTRLIAEGDKARVARISITEL